MELGVCARVVVVVVVACCFSMGGCQAQTDNHKGCYYDGDGDNSDRVLQDLISCQVVEGVCQQSCGPEEAYCESNTMTIAHCRTLCRDGNFQYYGLEGGNQCFCGGALSNPFTNGAVVQGTNCSDPCNGDPSKTCGGEFKIDVYEFQEPTEDPGCFFPGSVPYAIIDDVGVGLGETLTFRCQPGYELVGDSDLTCISNRTWSSGATLPICNYTGVIPETTTEVPPTTTAESTTVKPTTMANPTTVVFETTSLDVTTMESAATTAVHSKGSTIKPKPTQKSDVRDYLIYIIVASAVMGFLLVVCLIGILACTVRKRSGNAKQNIRLKPDDLAPVTLLNSGYTPDEGDAESGLTIPDILLAGNSPQAVGNLYANQGGNDQEMATFSRDDERGDTKGMDYPTGYAEMKSLSYPANPIYDSSEADPPKGAAGTTVGSEYAAIGNPSSDGSSSSTDTTEGRDGPNSNEYDNFRKWDSEDTLISDDGRALYADLDTTAATKL